MSPQIPPDWYPAYTKPPSKNTTRIPTKNVPTLVVLFFAHVLSAAPRYPNMYPIT